ncbi:MAG: HDIG domain-containing protein [Nitrososphaerota archaeon]|nr:HDIG domain-containing protein [Nitrososphaerota archaeon]
MNSELPSREQAIAFLRENNCSPPVISHCIAVANYALETAHRLQSKGLAIDLTLIEAGALLHDIGRSKTHGVDHSLIGAQIIQKLGLSKSIVNIVKRHVGAGITAAEANRLGWPKDDYTPQTLEEKIVCYADKRIDNVDVIPIDVEIERLQRAGFGAAAERVRRLHVEISSLLGESHD